MEYDFGLGTVSDRLWIPAGDNAIRVNLAARTKASYEFTLGPSGLTPGWVLVERCGDDLFVDECHVLLCPSPQTNGGRKKSWLHFKRWLRGVQPLDPRIAEALCENKRLVPERWRRTRKGRPQYIFFPGSVSGSFSGRGDEKWIANMCFGNDTWTVAHSAFGNGLRPDTVVATLDPADPTTPATEP